VQTFDFAELIEIVLFAVLLRLDERPLRLRQRPTSPEYDRLDKVAVWLTRHQYNKITQCNNMLFAVSTE